MRVSWHVNCFILIKISRGTSSQHLSFLSLNNNTRIGCERCSRLTKKTIEGRKSIVVVNLLGLSKLYTLFECFYGSYSQVNVRCCIGSISSPTSSHIHNAANHAIAKNSCQSYFKKFEVLFSGK